MSLSGQAARGSAITLGAQAIRLGLMLAGTMILSRLLVPSDFGLVAMVIAVTGVAQIFLDFGLSMAALQSKTLTRAQASNLFWINTVVGLALTVIVFALAVPISWVYAEPRLVPLVQITSVFYLAGGLTAQFRVAINRDLRFLALAMTDIIPAATALLAAVVCALLGMGVYSLAVQQLVIAFGTLLIAMLLARWFPGLPKRQSDMGGLLSFGMHFALTQLISYVTRNIDSVLIGRVAGAQALGQYDRAYQFSVVPINRINTPLSKVAVPVLSQITEDRVRFLEWLRRAQLVACYLTSSAFFVIAGASGPLTRVLLGPGWELAGVILGVLAISGVFRTVSQISYWMFISQGMAKQQLVRFLVTQPLIIAAMAIGLIWGPVGVAWGNVVGFGVTWMISLIWAGRASSLDITALLTDAVRVILVFGAPAGAAALVLSEFVRLPDLALIALSLLSALAWYGVSWLLFPFVRRDVAVLLGFLGKVRPGRK